jgi:hypothetical protein
MKSGEPKRSTAQGFWTFSANYFRAAEIVRRSGARRIEMPARQLYGQSLELALKAFLLKRGVPLDDVRSLSHRLTDIVGRARARRLGTEVKLTARDLSLIALLNENYSSHRFRYIESGSTSAPELNALAALTERVVSGLERYCMGKVWGRHTHAG